jgi:hypothetical protein
MKIIRPACVVLPRLPVKNRRSILAAHALERALASAAHQDADCRSLTGVNVYRSRPTQFAPGTRGR